SIFGGIVTIAVALFVEWYRRAVLIIKCPTCEVIDLSTSPSQPIRSYRVIVTNKLPCLLPFLPRNPAFQCEGEISFHHLDGQNIFGRSMRARWSESPEPFIYATEITTDKKFKLIDPSRLTSKIDIYPGEEKQLDIIAKFGNDIDTHGWSNESYSKGWHNPDWQLKPGRYLVHVIINSSGKKIHRLFRFINDVAAKDCRLEDAQKRDRIDIG
ncbi:MAG: hypothetical protein ACYC6Q_06375, partial [Syntrophales bacterium]